MTSPPGTLRPRRRQRLPVSRRPVVLGAAITLVAVLAVAAVVLGTGRHPDRASLAAPAPSAPMTSAPATSGPATSSSATTTTPTVRTVSVPPAATATAARQLPTNVYRSLRVTTPGFTDRYLRHGDDRLGSTEVVTADGPERLREQATWKVVPGLASSRCYSFESLDTPGQYLRHQEYRVRTDPVPADKALLFASDATWCARPVPGGAVRLTAFAFPDKYLRHINGELWLGTTADHHPWDAPASFAADTTWMVEPALAR